MARLSNKEIRRMNLDQMDLYTDRHPAEAWRFAKALGRSAIKLTKKAVSYGLKTEILFADPNAVLGN